jgi:outer membrane protein assembly factor BamB
MIYKAIGLGNKDGKYYILDRTNGNTLETPQLGSDSIPSGDGGIIGLAGFIYLNSNNPEIFVPSYYHPNISINGTLAAFIPSSNSLQWRFNTPGRLVGSVAIIPGAVLVGDEDGNLYAVSTTSGSQLFHATLTGPLDGGITEAEGFVLVAVSFGAKTGIYAFAP